MPAVNIITPQEKIEYSSLPWILTFIKPFLETAKAIKKIIKNYEFEKVEEIELLIKPGDQLNINYPVITIESDKYSI